jgi:hyaluronoglucosaminidase
MKRRTFLSNLGLLALSGTAWRASGATPLTVMPGVTPDIATGDQPALRPFHVTLPQHIEPLPYGSERPDSHPAFAIRGVKGWAWSPEQYLAEIPFLAKYRLNFLINCYSSLWELGPHGYIGGESAINFWYRPLSAEKQAGFEKVIRACRERGITFCFSINPNLRSDRAFDYERAEDMNALWQHYAWAQKLGVKWFNISLDDISTGINASGQARAVNALLRRLRKHDSEAKLTFCPTWYSGTGDSGIETNTTLGRAAETRDGAASGETPGVRYTRTLAEKLHSDVYLFWTGPEVCSLTISREQALRYRALCRHRILLFDNYPVNDQNPALHLGPFSDRGADLSTAIDGYFLNSMSYQNQANRIPMLTLADYLWNPQQYDPARSIGQAISHLGDTPAKRESLRELVELYPGRLWDKSESTGWNSLRARFDAMLRRGETNNGRKLLARAQAALKQMEATFPDAWASGTKILEEDVAAMTRRLG